MQSNKGEEGKKDRYELHPLYFYLICVLLRSLSENPTPHLLLINRMIAGREDAGLTVMHMRSAGGCKGNVCASSHTACANFPTQCFWNCVIIKLPVIRAERIPIGIYWPAQWMRGECWPSKTSSFINNWKGLVAVISTQTLHSCNQEVSASTRQCERKVQSRLMPSVMMFMLFI